MKTEDEVVEKAEKDLHTILKKYGITNDVERSNCILELLDVVSDIVTI